jgi:uncharacterized damage-inducible protein DinB
MAVGAPSLHVSGLAVCLVVSLAGSLGAGDPLAELKARWATSKAFTLEVAGLMPAGSYDFKPTPEEMSFAALMNHIATANEYRFSQVAGITYEVPAGPTRVPADKAAVIERLTDSFDRCAALLGGLTDAQLNQSYKVDWVGMPEATGRQILGGMFTHTAHHRGQAEVYLRLKGIKPPAYRY